MVRRTNGAVALAQLMATDADLAVRSDVLKGLLVDLKTTRVEAYILSRKADSPQSARDVWREKAERTETQVALVEALIKEYENVG